MLAMKICEQYSMEVIAKPPKTSHAKFAKYAKFCFMDDFANLADFADDFANLADFA